MSRMKDRVADAMDHVALLAEATTVDGKLTDRTSSERRAFYDGVSAAARLVRTGIDPELLKLSVGLLLEE